MARVATLFVFRDAPPGPEDLAHAAPGADVRAVRGGLLRRVRAYVLAWRDLEMRVALLDPADRQERLRATCRWIEEAGGGDGALQRRLIDAPRVLSLDAAPDPGEARVRETVTALRAALDACAHRDDRIEGARGERLAPSGDPPRAPSIERVRRRVLVVQALVARGHLEREEFEGRAEEPGRMLAWLQRQGAGDEIAEDERETLLRGPGLLDDARVHELTWLAEPLSVLAWSLGAYEPPPPDRLANPYRLVGGLGFLAEMLHPSLLVPEARGARACRALREETATFRRRLADGDPALTLRGAPRARADAGLVELCGGIAAGRLAALDWLLGDGPAPGA